MQIQVLGGLREFGRRHRLAGSAEDDRRIAARQRVASVGVRSCAVQRASQAKGCTNSAGAQEPLVAGSPLQSSRILAASSHVSPLLDPACVAEPAQFGAACVMPDTIILWRRRGLFSPFTASVWCRVYSVGAVMLPNMACDVAIHRSASVIAGELKIELTMCG